MKELVPQYIQRMNAEQTHLAQKIGSLERFLKDERNHVGIDPIELQNMSAQLVPMVEYDRILTARIKAALAKHVGE